MTISSKLRYGFKAHELGFKDNDLLSRWSFDETNGSWVRDLGPGRNDGMLMGNAVGKGRFGSGLVLDGTGTIWTYPFQGLVSRREPFDRSMGQAERLGFFSDLQVREFLPQTAVIKTVCFCGTASMLRVLKRDVYL